MMAEKLKDSEIVSRNEMLMAQMIQMDTVCQLLIEKGVFTQQEFFTKLKQVQIEYEARRSDPRKLGS